MATGIPYLDRRWDPVKGCSGCEVGPACYALRDTWRMAHNPNPMIALPHAGLVEKGEDGNLRWTGKVNLFPDRLEPLIRLKPTVYGVCFGGDLFTVGVPTEFIRQVFNTMYCADQHTFIVLTKQAGRLRECLDPFRPSPADNIWLGVSVTGPDDLWRIDDLLGAPALHRWVSLEPQRDAVDLRPYLSLGLDLVVVGCENSRRKETKCEACHGTGYVGVPYRGRIQVNSICEACASTGYSFYAWARQARNDCLGAQVEYVLKQGPGQDGKVVLFPELDGKRWDTFPWRRAAAAIRARGEELPQCCITRT